MSRGIGTGLIFAFAATALLTSAAAAQDFVWPEPKNLKSLPETFTGADLRRAMTGFSRALGVRCSHCHVGEEDAPLSTYDFASDANPKKDIARAMLDMLGEINKSLDEVRPTEGSQPANMWCHTCHRGLARPVSLGERLQEVLEAQGTEAAVAEFRELRAEHYGGNAYDFSEQGVESMARRLLRAERLDDAIAMMKLNVEFYPDSPRVHGGIGRLYAMAGRREEAIAALEKALALDPNFEAAAVMLEEIKSAEEKETQSGTEE